MALAHLVLGLVAGGMGHGYAIWRRIDDLPGARGAVQRSHVYAALGALERRRLVAIRGQCREGRRRRRRFEATAEGRAWLRVWLGREPSDAARLLQRPLLAKLAVRALLDERPSRREVGAERAARRQRTDGAAASSTGDALGALLRERARRHLEVERWLLEQLDARRSVERVRHRGA